MILSVRSLRTGTGTGGFFHYYNHFIVIICSALMILFVRSLRTGTGGEQDERQGLQWLLEAAGGGSAKAQVQVGQLYSEGDCWLVADKCQAYMWFKKAADQDEPDG